MPCLRRFMSRTQGHAKNLLLSSFPAFAFILSVMSYSAAAEANADLNSTAKTALAPFKITGFTDSELVASEIDNDIVNHKLALGSIRKKQNQLQPEIEIKLSGKISRLTFEIGNQYEPLEVYQYFLGQLQNTAFDILYQCHAYECGSNTHWANQVFKQRLLNGLERTQYYIVARLNTGDVVEPTRYIVCYLVQRGNKRLYVHFELITVGADQDNPVLDSQFYYEQLKTLKRVRVRGLSITKAYQIEQDSSKKAIQSVVHLLQNHPELKLVIVGHVNTLAAVKANLDSSLGLANHFNSALEEQGLQSPLPAYGLGPLAPDSSGVNEDSTAWIELVLVPKH